MNNQDLTLNEESLAGKREKLVMAHYELKQEFAGIDAVIDRVMETITPWYLFPQLQERPVIINLWGLTGVGKSSLINRLATLLDFNKQYFRFDLGESFDREYSIKRKLMTLFPENSGMPMMLAFDEFQHARTIDRNGNELDKGFIRIVWELLDSGKFTVNYVAGVIDDLPQLIKYLTHAVSLGIQVQHGKVVTGTELYKGLRNRRGGPVLLSNVVSEIREGQRADDVYLLDTYFISQLYGLVSKRFAHELALREYLDSLTLEETIVFLRDAYSHSLAHQYVDCTKSVVFVLGNLDEAYRMSDNFNPDISADEFHRESLKINISTVKKALSKRFRSEQIARLGNNHIIYPALNGESFRRIIRQELDRVRKRALQAGIAITFDASIHDLIYREGVFPTQGVRPLFTTVQQLVGGELGKIMTEKIQIFGHAQVCVNMKWEEKNILVEYLRENQAAHVVSRGLNLALGKLRESTRDDFQAITAVHESGHALLSMALLNVVPVTVNSVSAEEGTAGFVYSGKDVKFISRKEIPARLAVIMGGMAAEEVVFGREYVTTGAGGDLKQATRLVNRLIMENGLGDFIGSYEYIYQVDNNQFPADERLIAQSEAMLSDAYALAIRTLENEKHLLLHLAAHLSDIACCSQPELIAFAAQHGTAIDVAGLQQNERGLYYRSRLQAQLREQESAGKQVREIMSLDRDIKDSAA